MQQSQCDTWHGYQGGNLIPETLLRLFWDSFLSVFQFFHQILIIFGQLNWHPAAKLGSPSSTQPARGAQGTVTPTGPPSSASQGRLAGTTWPRGCGTMGSGVPSMSKVNKLDCYPVIQIRDGRRSGPDWSCGPKRWTGLKIWTMYFKTKGQIPKRLVKDRSLTGQQQTSPKIGTSLADRAISVV